MAADLEDVLAIQASRTGQATGEVTTVLRTLPGSASRRLPWRMRHPARWIASLAIIAALVAAGLILAASGAHKGTGVSQGASAPAGLQQVQLSQFAATDYNPFGTGPENRDLVENVIDTDPNTTWSTEQYYSGTLKKAGGTGLGIYLDAAPGVVAKALEIVTPTPGFAVQVYVANTINLNLPYGDSTPLTSRGWVGPVGVDSSVQSGARVALRLDGRRYRYYLLWLTTLPPGMQSASIAELALYR